MLEHTRPIVVGVDGSPLASQAARWALHEANLRGAGVALVHAWSFPAVALDSYGGTRLPVFGPDELERSAAKLLDKALAEAERVEPRVHPTGILVRGRAATVLCSQSETASLVVVGSHGLGSLTGRLLGSVSSAVLLHASCPVVVVPGEAHPGADRLVVGVDSTPWSLVALRWALREARLRHASVDVVHAWEQPVSRHESMALSRPDKLEHAAHQVLADALDAVADEAAGLEVRRVVARGYAADVLTRQARGADLVVVASRGHGPITGMLLGSVSARVVREASCPTVVVKGQGDASDTELEWDVSGRAS